MCTQAESMESHSEHWKGAHTHTATHIHLKRAKRLWSCLSRSTYYFLSYDGENSLNRSKIYIHCCVDISRCSGSSAWNRFRTFEEHMQTSNDNCGFLLLCVFFFSIRANLSMTTWLGTNVNAFPFERSTLWAAEKSFTSARWEKMHRCKHSTIPLNFSMAFEKAKNLQINIDRQNKHSHLNASMAVF